MWSECVGGGASGEEGPVCPGGMWNGEEGSRKAAWRSCVFLKRVGERVGDK